MSAVETVNFPTPDHDLLIEVNTIVKQLDITVKGYASDSAKTLTDHESRIRKLESDNVQLRSEIEGASKTRNSLIAILTLVALTASVVIGWLALRH